MLLTKYCCNLFSIILPCLFDVIAQDFHRRLNFLSMIYRQSVLIDHYKKTTILN